MNIQELEISDIVHTGIAVTNATKFVENCFYVETRKDVTILRIMTLIPMFEKCNPDALFKALKQKLIEPLEKKPFLIFNANDKEEHGLHLEATSSVLVVEYHFDPMFTLTSQYVYIGQAQLVKILTFREYEHFSDAALYTKLLNCILSSTKYLEKVSRNEYARRLRNKHGAGAKFAYLALESFDEYCRAFSKHEHIPYVSPPFIRGESGFQIGKGFARFTNATTDPCSFINTANLIRHLNGKGFCLSKRELIQFLPTMRTLRMTT